MGRKVNKRWIEGRLAELHLQKKDLGDGLGLSPPRVSDLLDGTRRLQIHEAHLAADVLKVTLPEIYSAFGLNPRKVRLGKILVRAYIDATSGTVIARDAVEEPLEEVDAPQGYFGEAARIKGNSMAPRYRDGEFLCFTRDGHDIAHLLNQEVVIELEDGRRLLKILHPGSKKNLYTLTSLNPDDAPIVDVAIRWAAPIDFHIPRRL